MKILIIEDNEKLANSIKDGLAQNGFAADYITDGAEGERRLLISHNDYDAVILDLLLPGKDGIAICKRARAAGIKIPILMLTARISTEDKIKGLDSGADDYLPKPFAFDELVARIRALLRRPEESVESELRIGGLSINANTRTVELRGEKVDLTLKEFMVLEYLMRHPGKVVTRDELYDHAWDFAANSFSNTVDVHIKNLRKKLKDNDEKILETIRGVGYRLKK